MAETQTLKKCSLADNPFDVLPREILADILLKLPIKALVSCACSCKYLSSFLTGPLFTDLLARRNYKNPFIFFRYYLKKKFKQYYSLQPDDDFFNVGKHEVAMPIDCSCGLCFNVVGILNGLICLSDDLYVYSNVITLWNPSIRKSLELPESSIAVNNHSNLGIVVGFGFDSHLYDYKVVRLAYMANGKHSPPSVEVYSLKIGYWKPITEQVVGPSCDIRNPNPMLSYPSYSHCFLRWACHWPGWRDNVWSAIVTFNITNEVFGEFKLPHPLEGSDCHNVELKVSLWGMTNMLVVIQMQRFFCKGDERIPCNCSRIWLMKEYGVVDSWTCIFSYPIPEEYPTPRVYSFRKNLDYLILIGSSDLYTEENHTLYCMNRNVSKELGQVKGKPFGFYLSLYRESLALLKEGKAVHVSALERSRSEGEDDEEAQNEEEDNQEAQNQKEDNQESQNQGEDDE